MKPTILVVEDDAASRELLEVWLQAEGYSVRCTSDILSSQAALGEALPDLILLDIGLGTENGLELAAWIRRQPHTAALPVIAVTAHAMVSERERIFATGCNAFLPKPVDFRELQALLRDWLFRTGGESASSGNPPESNSERSDCADQSLRGG